MRRCALGLIILSMIGCVSPQDRLFAFSDFWVGRSADLFVEVNGVPRATYIMGDGRRVHEFGFGGDRTAHMEHSGTDRGSTVHTVCVLRVEADAGRIITSIRIASDSTGLWVSSRCFEVLPAN